MVERYLLGICKLPGRRRFRCDLSNGDWSTPWDDYTNTLTNIAAVVRLTANDPALVNENAMARIWKVWLYQRMTDAYGDIPYFPAALSPDSANNQPQYDTQEAIYIDMLKIEGCRLQIKSRCNGRIRECGHIVQRRCRIMGTVRQLTATTAGHSR